jgi:uncharacterized protein YfaT (DUF1175 family)
LRRRQKKLVTATVVCTAVLVIAFARVNGHSSLATSLRDTSIEADGAATTVLEVYGAGRDAGALKISSSDPSLLRVDSVNSSNGRVLVGLRAGVLPGKACVRVRTPTGVTREVTVTLTPNFADSYQDGTPDFLRLGDDADAESFRRWFAFLAEAQFFLQAKLPREVNDCASLLRFAYRESLRRHDGEWAAALSLPRLPAIQEVRQYSYPHTPLGASLFRIRPGAFAGEDLRGGAFAEFADADCLRRFNTYFVSRRIQDARTGDLIFFHQGSQRSPFHVMTFIERSALDGTAEPLLVYHTGRIGDSLGEVRRPTLRELLHYPDARWRPLPENRGFLGVYRWNILRGAN